MNFIVSVMLVNKSEKIWSQTRGIHKASELRCHFFDHLSCFAYSFLFTQCISEHFTPNESNAESIRFPMSFFWSFVMLEVCLTLHTMHNWTFNLYGELSRIFMHQRKILWPDLNSGIFSYDQKCHAFFWICRTFEALTLAPLRPRITL